MLMTEIREMTTRDLNEVMVIEQATFASSWPRDIFQQILENNNGHGYILTLKKEIIGYICILKKGNAIHLANFALKEEYRNKGMGTKFLQQIIDSVSGDFDFIYLEVRKSNKKAIKLYENFGFKIYQIIADYYLKPKEDALLMVKLL